MRVFRCDVCSNEVEDYQEARWLRIQWYTGERVSSGYFGLMNSDSRDWLLCSPACVARFAELESLEKQT